MTENIVKEGYKAAEEELKKDEINKIKNVVKATLEKLSQKENQQKEIAEEIKILKKDLDNLRDGRIDLIKERQDINAKAKEVSVIIIKEKIIEKQVPMWYYPWIIEVKPCYVPYVFPTYTMIDQSAINAGSTNFATTTCSFETTNSSVRWHTTGTYQLADGTVKYI